MREIRPYGSEGGGGETLPTPIKITALARDATPTNQNLAKFLHRLTEQELAVRAMYAVVARIKEAAFTVEKDYDT
jgi:hypothetical protein